MQYLMGIDIGTTSVRTIIVDEKGKLISEGVYEYPLYHPWPLWAEQEPQQWWECAKKLL